MEIKKNDADGFKQDIENQKLEASKELLRETYDLMIEKFKEFIDLKEENYNFVVLWTIGTYFHKNFNSYPYLFINAMRGSGKTRLLKLIKETAKNGEVIMSLTESVLFRSDNNSTMLIDEFEGVVGKDKSALRELLNASYKKGIKVKRMRKSKSMEGERQVIEEFELYRPIAMANILGMEEVLESRCIPIFLEKSFDPVKTLLIEAFDFDPEIKQIRTNFDQIFKTSVHGVDVCSFFCEKDIYTKWNNYVKDFHNIHDIHNIHTYTHTHIYTQLHTTLKQEEMFRLILESNIDSRNLELFFPIFQIAELISPEVLKKTIEYARDIVKQKKIEDTIESKDIMLYKFVSDKDRFVEYSVKELTMEFKDSLDMEFEELKSINTHWFGQSLKRLSLTLSKKRTRKGILVMLDIDKAKSKSKIFNPDKIDDKEECKC